MVSAEDIPWEVIIFVSIFAIVLFYFVFFQGYLTAAIYKCIIKCFLPKKLSISFKYIQFSILSGHITIYDLAFANLSMRVEIARLCVALKYWSKVPEFNENDKNDDKLNDKDINNVEWIRSSHEPSETDKANKIKKKKGIFKTIFDRKSRFIVNIDGLHVTLYNQSEDAISRIETFRKIYELEKKTTEEATKIYNEMYPSNPPQAYQLSIIMRVILPLTFKVRGMAITIGNPNLPSTAIITSKKVKGIFTMLKKEDLQHSLKQRITLHMKDVKIRFAPNDEFDKTKFIKDSMRNLDERFELTRTILYTNVLNAIYTQDAYGCYIRSEDKDKAMLATAEPKSSVQVGLMSPIIEYGSYADKLRSAFMRYFKPFLFINPTIYPNSTNRVKYMDITVLFFGEKPSLINLPFTTSQNVNESLIISFDNTPESTIKMILPQYVSTKEENKMEVNCNFIHPKIRTSLSESFVVNKNNQVEAGNDDDETVIIKSSTLLVQYLTYSPEKWYEKGTSECLIHFERCKMRLAPYHIDLLTDLGTDFVSTYPFEPTIDEMDFFQPSEFMVTFKMVDAKIQLLSKSNPRFEEIFRIKNHQRMVIRTPIIRIDLKMPSLVYHEYEKSVSLKVSISSPTFKFFLPNDNMNQFRRNCYKWAHNEADRHGEADTKRNQRFQLRRKFNEEKKSKSKSKEIQTKPKNYNYDDDDDDDDLNVKLNDDEDEDLNENLNDDEFCVEEEDDFDVDFDDDIDENHSDDHFNHKFIKHEYLGCSSIDLIGSYKWNKNNGDKQFPLIVKVGPSNGLISVVCIKSLLAVISNYSSSNKSHPNTDVHNKAFENWVKPKPEFPNSVMHMHINVQIIKADVGIPFDLYDTSAFLSLHAANFFLSVDSYAPYFHVLIGLPSISITFNKTHFPNERFYYERIGSGMIHGNPQEVLHIDGINFAIKNSQVLKPKPLTLFSLMGIDVGDIKGTISIYQLFALLDLALNFTHLWFSFDVAQQLEPDLDSIFLPRQMQVIVRGIFLIVDFVQYGLMMINLPNGIVVYQDNMINKESHKAMFVNIPTIDVHHIYQPSQETGNSMKKKKKRKKKMKTFPRNEKKSSSSSHNKVASLIDSTSSLSNPNKNELEEEEEEDFEEEKIEKIEFLSQLRSVFRFTTYISIIRRGRYNNYDNDSKIQMKYLNEYDPNHQFLDLINLPQNVKLPKIFCNYDATLDDEYTLTKTNKPDPNSDNYYELQIPEIFYSSQKKYPKSDIYQWIHLFQIQRFSSFGSLHKNDSIDQISSELNPNNYIDLRRDMHIIVSSNTKALMNMEYMVVVMLMVKTFKLQPDSHFLSSIARDVVTDLWMKKILKKNNMSLILSNVLISIFDFNREVKLDLNIRNIDYINLNEINVSNEMTLSISDISLNVYSKSDIDPAATLDLSLINLGKINGETSIRIHEIIGKAPYSTSATKMSELPLVKVINYSLSYILPIFKEIESPNVGGGMNDFKQSLERYIDDEENLDVYYHPEAQNDNNNENDDDNNNNNIDDDDYVNIDEDSRNDHHSHHHSHHGSHRKANKVKNHLPKFHVHHKKKNKKKKNSSDESQKEETSTDIFLSKESIVDEERNTSISRYFLAYAKLCNDRKCLMNFVDNVQFDNLENYEEEEEETNANGIDANEIRGNYASRNYHAEAHSEGNNPESIPQIKLDKSEDDIKIDNDIRSYSIKVSRTVIRISIIQFNLLDSVCNIKLDPISLISKGEDFGFRFVIKSIYVDLKEDMFTFISAIKKPKKERVTTPPPSASKKFVTKKKKNNKAKKAKKKFIIHFIFNTLAVKLKVIKLDVKYLSALVNIANPPYASLSLMSLVFGDSDFGMIYMNGFDFNYSKEVNHGSFCLRPIGVKVSLDLLLNPKGCYETGRIDLSKIKRRKKFRKSNMEPEEREQLQTKKTEKIVQNVQKFNQSETKHSIIELLDNISFFFIVNKVKIEATIDRDLSTKFTFPGARGVLFNPKNFKALLYLQKPKIHVTNLLKMALFDVFMYGYYEPFLKQLTVTTMSGDVKVETCQETLTHIAQLINNLLSKRPPKEENKQSASKNQHRNASRKSVANISLIDNNSSSIAYKSIKSTSKQKNNKKNNDKSIDNLSTNVIKVVNTISSGINVIVRFVMPLITIRLPEIASTLNIVKPMVSVKCQNKMIFDASIHKLDLQVDHSFVSIGINFTKDNEEKTFTMNNLLVVVTPSLFDHIIKMKNFFTTIKQELKSQYFLKLNENFQSTVKSGFNNIIDLDAFSDNKRSKMQNSMKSDLDIPTIINDKYVIIFNNTLINLKLTNEADQVMEKERRKSSANIRHNPTEGFVLNISTIFLCMETRKSEMHNKLATAARFLLENLIFEDKNEKQNSDKTVKSKEFSAVKCEKANISALSFVNHLNVDVSIKSFHISVFPTVPFIFIDFIDLIKTISNDMMKIKAEKIEKNKISEKKKFELKNRRRSYVKITPKSSYVIFDINVENTAVILNSPNTEFAIPTVSVYGIFEKTKANFSTLKLQSTVRIEPIQMSISPPIIHWFEKLIKNLGNANEVMSKNPQSTSNSSSSVISPSNSPKKHKKAALTKFTLHLTLLVDQIDFNLGCQPSPVMLLFALKKFVTHFTTTTNCLSFQIGEVSLSTDKIVDNRKASFFSARSYRPKAMSHAQANDFSSSEDNTDRLLSIKVAPIVGLFGSKVQAFNVGLLGLSVSNNEMEDFFTFLKVWFEPISDLLKKLSKMLIDKNHRRHHHHQHRNSVSVNHFRRRSSIFHLKLPIDLTNNSSINRSNSGNNSPTAIKGSSSSGRISFAESKNGANNNNNGSGGGEKKSKFTLNIIARVQALSISFGYSGVNGKIGLLIKPILFSNTKLSTNLRIPEIDLTASGFVEGKVQIKPVIFQVNSAASNLESNSSLNVTSNSSSSSAISTKKRLDSVIIINSIDGNIKSYRDPLLSFSLKGIYLFYLLVPQSDQILSLIVDSPKLKMTSQAISKFKRIIASITDPIKDAIINTKRATSSHKGPQTLQPRLNRPAVSHFSLSSSSIENSIDSDRKLKEKTKRKVKIAKARLDLLLEKLQVELYKYYLTDKEAVKATVTKASLTVDLHENLKDKNTNNNDPLTQRNMNFVFYPMSLLRLFCNNGTVIDQRSVLLIPKIIGSLNTTQQNQNVSYDFNTKFSDSVEASLSITDYEAVRAIIMFAVTSLKSSNGIENAYEIEQMENTNKINPAKNNKNKSHNINNNNDNNNNNNNTNNDDANKKRKFEFTPNTYQFSPQFKIALGAKIQPNVEWVLQMLGIKDDHVIPATLFQYVCVGLQDLLEYIAQTVTND